ncbi:MAG TPA: alanine--tRNA ligase [Jiangellaceae bacterium]|nr:alanine--tRNA ligase [Jiangellaceae bacterium]
MRTAEIRQRFLDHFERAGHTVVPSASVVSPDPSVLFTIAGMVPFIPYLTGQQTPPWSRAVSVQKCVRTADIEEVGKTTRHGTFFQMNGNFSFGDYFKEGAITYAWELLTKSQDSGGYGFDPERLWVTVYEDDPESYDIWTRTIGFPAERVQKFGKEENYWDTGQPGPCGPDSEIWYDLGPEYGKEGGPAVNEDRYMELWNLVFMEFLRGEGPGKDYEILGELPSKNIDTGMGLERVAYLLQGVNNIYETDQVHPVIGRAAELAGTHYGAKEQDDVRLRLVGDHVRSALMIVNDGIVPGNEGRGYVLRRLLRRSVRAMRLLGVEENTLPELLPASRDVMGEAYPELHTDFERISEVIYAEEEAFANTLRTGTAMFDLAAVQTKQAGNVLLAGDTAFKLHDTYGFPIDLTLEMAAEQGLSVDEAEFRRLMTEQRDRAKADAQAKKSAGVDLSVYGAVADTLAGPVEFTGYTDTEHEAAIVALVVDGQHAPMAPAGQDVEIILDRTPFYAESGGQLADHGTIAVSGGGHASVTDVQIPMPGVVVHRARVEQGELAVGQRAHAAIDLTRRRAVSRSHTGTHLVHQALRDALGSGARQAGSEDAPGRLRLDFTAPSGVPSGTVEEVEAHINERVRENLEVYSEIMPKEQALASGALAFFGEKYGDDVRVVSIGEWSKEFCGGTHAPRAGALGMIKVLGESSIGQGVRRVEALVGADAYQFMAREHALVTQLTDALKVPREQLTERVGSIVSQLREAERELARVRAEAVLSGAGSLAEGARDLGGVRTVTHDAGDGVGADDLRRLVLDVRNRLGGDVPAVVAMTAQSDGRPVTVVAVNDGARARGLRAGDLVRLAAQQLGGGGGGKDDVAQGGGSDPTGIPSALTAIEHAVYEASGT